MIKLLLPFLVLLVPIITFSQACSCDEAGECLVVFPANSTNTVCYEVDDLINDDLSNSNQGVCGVRLNFYHAWVWDLEISLTSPSGQTVQLTGDQVAHTGLSSSLAHWDILFVPNSETAVPDTIGSHGYAPQWDNDQTWLLGGQYHGSYYPVHADVAGGSLEDFNTGTANGVWCLEVTNHNNTATTYVYDFSVIFCDPSGLICCDADAGQLSQLDSILACEGDSSLVMDFQPDYGSATPPDTSIYDYTYIISQNDIILAYQSSPDLISYSAGTYNICGFSYKADEAGNIPAPDGTLTVTDLVNDINDGIPLLCGNITDECVPVIIAAPPAPTEIYEEICEGDTVIFNGNPYFQSGDYQVVLPTAAQCDSLINYHLTVHEIDTVYVNEEICDGDSFMVGSTEYNTTGVFTTVLQTALPCDSVVILDLVVMEPIETNVADTICMGEVYNFGDEELSLAGDYSHVFVSAMGCDSLVNLSLTVIDLQAGIDTPAGALDCNHDLVVLTATAASNIAGATTEWSTTNGHFANIDSLQATVDMPGDYTITVNAGNCVSSSSVTVAIDTVRPFADAGGDKILNCIDSVVVLDGSNSSSGADFTYEWSGGIDAGQGTNTATVGHSGTYTLVVSDITNGCTDTSSVNVGSDMTLPQVDAGEDDTLTCDIPVLTIGNAGNTSNGAEFTYFWLNSDGDTIAHTVQTDVDYAGSFWLNVINTVTGCHNQDFVTITSAQVPIEAVIETPDTLKCNLPQVTLHGENSLHVLNYHWSTLLAGNIVSGTNTASAIVDEPGTYQLVVDTLGGCTDTATVLVLIDTIRPFADAGGDTILNCRDSVIVLDGSNSSSGSEYSYEWLGGVASGQGTNTATVDVSGNYTLIVTDNHNGCRDSSLVIVGSDAELPDVEAGIDKTLTCLDSTQVIGDAANTSSGAEFTYYWLNSSGDTISHQIVNEVDYADVFWLNVTNTNTGCHSRDSVVITSTQVAVTAQIELPDTITCSTPEVVLHGENSLHVLNYHWSTLVGGNIVGIDTAAIVLVDEPGVYQLAVDTIGGCTDTTTVLVLIDTIRPFADAGGDTILSCRDSVIMLDGSNSSSGSEYSYEWLGGVASGQGTNTATVDVSGNYTLIVTDNHNGCRDSSLVIVGSDAELPDVEAGIDKTLTCLDSTQVIGDAANTSSGTEFSYYWLNSSGDTISHEVVNEVNYADVFWLNVTNTNTGCHSRDSVTVFSTQVAVTAQIDPPDTITCSMPEVVLHGENSLHVLNYHWSTLVGGNIVGIDTAATVLVDEPGVYQLAVDTIGGCTDTTTVLVLGDTMTPQAVISLPDTLNCINQVVMLDGSGSTANHGLNYNWFNLDGLPMGDPTAVFCEVTEPGIYYLEITDAITGCTDTTTVEVIQEVAFPVANAGRNRIFNCASADTLWLSGLASTPIDSISFLWETASGDFVSTDSIAVVDTDGDYRLIVTDDRSMCTDTAFVQVRYDTIAPMAFVATPDSIDCSADTVSLYGSSSPVTGVTYEWVGGIISGQGTTTAQVIYAHDYGFVVTDVDNFCTDTAFVSVISTSEIPDVEAGISLPVTCIYPSRIIGDPSGTAQGDNITYTWTNSAGDTISDSIITVVTYGDVFSLTVTNTATGCVSQDSVLVGEVVFPVEAIILEPDTLDCMQGSIHLQAVPDSNAISYNWTTLGGHIVGTPNTETITVDQPGIYYLQVNALGGCQDRDSVTVIDLNNTPVADAGDDVWLDCLTGTALVGGENTSEGGFTYLWTTPDGHFVTTEERNQRQILVDSVGTYILSVTDTAVGCVAKDTVLANMDCVPEAHVVATNGFVDCVNTDMLIGSYSPTGDVITYHWYGPGLTEEDITTTLTPSVNEGGTYFLVVTNTLFGTSDTASVYIEARKDYPDSLDLFSGELTCYQMSPYYVLAANYEQVDTLEYLWETGNGQFYDVNIDSLHAKVVTGGIYSLTITNPYSHCTIRLGVNLITPMIHVEGGEDIQFTCTDLDTRLDTSYVPDDAIISWSPTSLILEGENTATPLVVPDFSAYQTDFVITATDTLTGCQATDTVTVFSPVNCGCEIAFAQPPDTVITCYNPEVALEETLGNYDDGFVYQWNVLPTTGDTIPLGVGNQSSTGFAGTVILNIVDTVYGVVRTTCQLDVTADLEPPAIQPIADMTVDCRDTAVVLTADNMPIGDNWLYHWETPSGTDNNQLLTTSDAGTYSLFIQNLTNGCFSDTISVQVDVDTIHPTGVDAGEGTELTCASNTAVLRGFAPHGGFSYLWTAGDGGDIITGTQTILTPTVRGSGTYYLTVTNDANHCKTTDSVIVTQDISIPKVKIVEDSLIWTCADTVKAFHVGSSTSQGDFFEQEWTTITGFPLGIGDSIIPASLGYYILTVENINTGCKISDTSFVVEHRLPPQVFIDAPVEISCNSPLPALQGNYLDVYGDPCSFVWAGEAPFVSGENTLTPVVNQAGNYTLTVTNDSTGCTNDTTVTVTKTDDIPVIPDIPTSLISCRQPEIILDGTDTAHYEHIVYEWFATDGGVIVGSADLPRVRVSAAGNYLLVITDTLLNCHTDTATVTVYADLAAPNAVIVKDSVPEITCRHHEVVLDASLSTPVDSVSFYWTTDEGYIISAVTEAELTVGGTGWYQVEVTDMGNGCRGRDSILVVENLTKPEVAIIPPTTITCDEDTVLLTGMVPEPVDAYFFLWTSPFSTEIIDSDSLIAKVTSGGTYTLIVTNRVTGCDSSATVTVDENTIRPVAHASTMGDLNCEITEVQLSGAGSTSTGVDYLWETVDGNIQSGATTLTPTVTESAWYTLSVTSRNNGCTGVDSTFVEEIGSTITGMKLDITQPDCRGQEFGSVVIDSVYGATYPLLYGLTPGVFEDYNFFISLDTGSYHVYVQDVYGCEFDTTFEILPTGDLTIDIGDDISVPLGDSVHIHAEIEPGNAPVDTIVWEPVASMSCPGCLDQDFVPLFTGKIKATVIDENGCEAWDILDLNVYSERPFYIPSAFSPNGDYVNDILTVYPGKGLKEIRHIAIFDRWGNQVFSSDNIPAGAPFSGWDGSFEGKPLNPQVFVWYIDVEYLDGAVELFVGDVTLVR